MSSNSRPRTTIFWYTEYSCFGRPITRPRMRSSRRSESTASMTFCTYSSRCGVRCFTRLSISA